MIFHKPREFDLIIKSRMEMLAHRPGLTLPQAVIEPLVISVVEPRLLEGPFQVPINLGHKTKARNPFAHQPDGERPEWQRLFAPSTLKHLGKNQHRHVATDTITLAGNSLEFPAHRLLGGWIAVIELQGVRPAREVRIPAMSQN